MCSDSVNTVLALEIVSSLVGIILYIRVEKW